MNNSLALSLSQSGSRVYKTKKILKRIICIYFVLFFVFIAVSIIVANAAITPFGIFFKRIFTGNPPKLEEGDIVTEEHLQMLEWHERLAYYCLHIGQRPSTMLENSFYYDIEGRSNSESVENQVKTAIKNASKGQLTDAQIQDIIEQIRAEGSTPDKAESIINSAFANAPVKISVTTVQMNAIKQAVASGFNSAIESRHQAMFYSAWATVSDIYKALQTIGLALCIAYAVMYIVDSASADRVSPEQVIKIAIRMLISVLIILNGMRIMEGMIGIANLIMHAVSVSQESGDSDVAIYNAVREMDLGKSINACIEGLVNFLRNGLVALVGIVSVYGRTIQICVLGAFAPIGFADSYNGMNSGAVRYAKRFFAALLQSALVVAVIMITAAMRTGLATNPSILNGVTSIYHIIITFAGIGAISATKRWSEQIVGAM